MNSEKLSIIIVEFTRMVRIPIPHSKPMYGLVSDPVIANAKKVEQGYLPADLKAM